MATQTLSTWSQFLTLADFSVDWRNSSWATSVSVSLHFSTRETTYISLLMLGVRLTILSLRVCNSAFVSAISSVNLLLPFFSHYTTVHHSKCTQKRKIKTNFSAGRDKAHNKDGVKIRLSNGVLSWIFEFAAVAYRKPVRTLFNNIQTAVKFELQCGYIRIPAVCFRIAPLQTNL